MSIAESAFYGCSRLSSIIVEDSNPIYDSRNWCNAIIATAANILLVGCMNTVIPHSITTIGDFAFCDCSSLASIAIPDSVRHIGSWAFSGCCGLSSVTIPDGVTNIGSGAFSGCSSLISISIPDSVTD